MKKDIYQMMFALVVLCIAGIVNASAQNRTPLYRYQSNSGYGAYAAFPEYRNMFLKNSNKPNNPSAWNEYGAVGYVLLTKQAGTLPLLSIVKTTKLGNKYFYSTDVGDVIELQKSDNQWRVGDYNNGIVCYVSTTKQPGTIAVYRYKEPGAALNHIYAFGEKENNLLKQNKALTFDKIAFYVWEKPNDVVDSGVKPDLDISDVTNIADKSVTFVVNSYTSSIPKQTVRAKITAYRQDGSVAWSQIKIIAQQIPNNPPVKITIDLNEGKNLTGLKFKLKIDSENAVDESNESNNETALLAGPELKIITGTIITTPPATNIPVTPVPAAKVDLSMRQYLYFNGAKADKVDTAAKSVPANGVMKLKMSELDCNGNICSFKMGLLVFKNPGEGEVTLFVYFTGGASMKTERVRITFAAGETAKDVVKDFRLGVGENKVRVELDPTKQITETDENNNSFELKIIIEP